METSASQYLTKRLTEAFSPSFLAVDDDSARHAGHAEGGKMAGTHFQVTIVSRRFEGLSRVERHRLVYEQLKEDLKTGMHALAIRALTPQEAAMQPGSS